MRRNAGVALGIVILLIAAALAIDACLSARDTVSDSGDLVRVGDAGPDTLDAQASSIKGATSASEPGRDESLGAVFLRDLMGKGSTKDAYRGDLPAGFEGEAFDCSVYDEVLVSADESVIGLVGKGTQEEAFEHASRELIEHGWVRIESKQEALGTFVKEAGVYTWLMLSCSAVGDHTGIVVHVR